MHRIENSFTDEVIKQAVGGDRAAFESIYRRFSPMVYSVALGVLNNTEDSQEVTQDVFVKIYHQLKNFRFDASLKTWIYRVTINTALNYRKKRAHRENQVNMDEATMDHFQESNAKPEITDQEEHQQVIQKLLSHLNPDQRTCIILRNMEGLTYEEIAQTLRININTVRTRLKRAREKLLSIKQEVTNNEMG